MNWTNIKRQARYAATFLRHRGIRATARYGWFYLAYCTDLIRENRVLAWLINNEDYPRMIEVETTTACNLRCTMCEHTYWNYPARNMSFEQFKHIVDQFPRLYWIGMTGIGSSFLNKDFPRMVEYVHRRGVIVDMFDHFNDLTDEQIEWLVRVGVERMWASVDACTKEVYEQIRVGGNFDKVTANLRKLIATKARFRSPFPQLSFQFIITRQNLHQVPEFVDFVQAVTDGDNFGIRFSPLICDFAEIKDMDARLERDYMREAERRATKYGMLLVWNKVHREGMLPMRYCTEWTQPFFLVDGSVVPCCATNEHNAREYQIKTALGNIFQQSFKEIWDGPKYRALRETLKAGGVPPPCVQCPVYARPEKTC